MKLINSQIRNSLEEKFGVPFSVEQTEEDHDPGFTVIPQNDHEELFEVKIKMRQHIRIISEIKPQKHSAVTLAYMGNAPGEKQKIFTECINFFVKKGCGTELDINGQQRDHNDPSIWDEDWKKFNLRITGIIPDESTEDDEQVLVREWAVMSVCIMMSLLDIEESGQEESVYTEGGVKKALVNRYERNPVNRELCLAANGYRCAICGFDFEEKYGRLGYRFIHVHHIEKISSFDSEYYIDPVNDLIPVCPNCHAMLHRTDPPLKPDELRDIISKNSQ